MYDYRLPRRAPPLCLCGRIVPKPRQRNCPYICMAVGLHAGQYRLTAAEYMAMFESQGEACAPCGRRFGPELVTPCIDHDHATGKVRGIVCQSCNLRIAYFERADVPIVRPSDAEYVARVMRYLGRITRTD